MKIDEILIEDWNLSGKDTVIIGADSEEELDNFNLNKGIKEIQISELYQKIKKVISSLELKNGSFIVSSSETNTLVKILKENSVFVSQNDEDISWVRSNGCTPDPGDLGRY